MGNDLLPRIDDKDFQRLREGLTYLRTKALLPLAANGTAIRDLQFGFEGEQYDYLYGLITFNDGGRTSEGAGMPYGKRQRYAEMLYLVRIAFGLHRRPGYEDRLIDRIAPSSRESRERLDQVDESVIQCAAAQLRELHTHHLTTLKTFGLTHVRLVRRMFHISHEPDRRHLSALANAVAAARLLGEPTVPFHADTIQHFGTGGYENCDLALILDVPIEDILCASTLMRSRVSHSDAGAGETGEWLALNRDPKGIMQIPVDRIFFSAHVVLETPPRNATSARRLLERLTPLEDRFDAYPSPELYCVQIHFRWRRRLVDWLLRSGF